MAIDQLPSGKYRVRVNRAGVRRSATFARKSDAQAWESRALADAVDARLGRVPDHTVADAIRRLAEMRTGKDAVRLNALLRDPLADVSLRRICKSDIASWRDRRLSVVSPASVNREWNTISGMFSLCIREWGWLHANPMRGVARPPDTPPRTRRISADELARLLHCAGYENAPSTMTSRVAAVLLFALETAMRAGEICGLAWEHVHLDRHVAHLPKTKNGSARDVPLSAEAVRLIEQCRGVDDRLVFGMTTASLDALWRKIKRRALCDDIHFHDSRATALTRLSQRLDVMQLARMSGHRDIKILYAVYYRETAEAIARLL